MKRAFLMAASVFLCVSICHGQHLAPAWDAQHEELQAIWNEMRALGEKC
jgi:hypothetical protein